MKKRRWIQIEKPYQIMIYICIIFIIISINNIMEWNKDNQNIKKELEEISNKTIIKETPVNEKQEEIIPQEEKKEENDDYWKYIKLPVVDVDFTELLNINNETVAFLKVNGTKVNYPVVQTTDNKFYLNHSFNKKKNNGGWVFMDYRNNINDYSANTIIYAHGRVDTTMFGSLKDIFKEKWYKNTGNYIMQMSTLKENTLWQIFSAYTIEEETYYLTSDFGSDESHRNFLNTISSRSKINFNTSAEISDKILTLSTCYKDTKRIVVHAKLIKKTQKIN